MRLVNIRACRRRNVLAGVVACSEQEGAEQVDKHRYDQGYVPGSRAASCKEGTASIKGPGSNKGPDEDNKVNREHDNSSNETKAYRLLHQVARQCRARASFIVVESLYVCIARRRRSLVHAGHIVAASRYRGSVEEVPALSVEILELIELRDIE